MTPIDFRYFTRRASLTLLLASLVHCFAFVAVCDADSAPGLDLGSIVRRPANGETPNEEPPLDAAAPDEPLRVALLGSTWIERMSDFGYLETALTTRWPGRDILFRNLGRSGDNVLGDARAGFGPSERDRSRWQRPSAEFGDYGFDQMLSQITEQGPDVILIGYGSRVAFEGDEGLERFEKGMLRLLEALEPTGVRIVLLSPPPHEARSSHFPDMTPQNERLSRAAQLLRRIGKERGHSYVEVFERLESALQQDPKRHLTDNGIHLNEHGYRLLAAIVAQQLATPDDEWGAHLTAGGELVSSSGSQISQVTTTEFGLQMQVQDDRQPTTIAEFQRVLRIDGLQPGQYALDIDGSRVVSGTAAQWAAGVVIHGGPDFQRVEQLRQAIIEKNRLFFFGFRPQNKAYIYLFRRHERGHHAGEVSQFAALVAKKEREIARLRTPLRRQYELVREKDYPENEVPVDVPAPDVQRELASFDVAEGLQANLFASEPMVANPINANWDERGRLWVATSSIYPHLRPGQMPNDKIIILEDIDGDGRADVSTVFADDLLVPQSVIPANGGAYVAQSTDLLFLQDVDGDDRADVKRVVFSGFGNADVHHMVHGFRWSPGGDLLFQQSIYINSYVETPWGPRQLNGSGTWRMRPETLQLEIESRGLVNPWGYAFDRWGQSFATDGAGGNGIAYVFPGSVFVSAPGAPRILKSLNQGHPKACGLEITSGSHLPDDWQGNMITTDFRANRVVRYALAESGSGYTSQPLDDVLTTDHRSFRPVDIKMGPDGALYIVDWYSPIIDHGEVDFHHPLRDRSHGRIWRLSAKDRPLVEPPPLAEAPTQQLLELLRFPEDWSRDQARRLLRERAADEVLPHLQQWIAELDPAESNFEHLRLEGLWMHQGLRRIDEALLRDVLASPDSRARAAAVRVLSDWSAHIPGALDLLSRAAVDDHAQVRLEAVNALRQHRSNRAADVVMQALDMPLDDSLDFALWLTCRELKPYWLPALQAGRTVFGGDDQKLAFAISAIEDPSALQRVVELVQDASLTADDKQPLLMLMARLGGPAEQAVVLQSAVNSAVRSANESAALLDALAESATTDQTQVEAEQLAALLNNPDSSIRVAATNLSGNWQIATVRPQLLHIAGDAEKSPSERYAAATALLNIDETTAAADLARLAEGDSPARITATAAWAARDPEGARQAAVDLLSTMTDSDDPTLLLAAFVDHRNGPQVLVRALEDRALAASVAATGVRLADESGRDLSALMDAFIRAGSLKPLAEKPNAVELAQLVHDVDRLGDPHRGEAIYRRAESACSKCHAIGGVGGRVGPDLASLGGSAQLGHLFESLFDPSAKIKEGFQTQSVLTDDGKVLSGRVERQTAGAVLLRDAQDNMINIPEGRVEEIVSSQTSLMPTGLPRTMRRDELVDLVRFLSLLGKDERFRVPTRPVMQQWEVLQPSAELVAQLKSTPTKDAVGDADAANWKRVYSTVSGGLPLSDIPAIETAVGRVGVVRFTVKATRLGALELRIDDTDGLSMWSDASTVNVRKNTRIAIDEGPLTLWARIDLSKRQTPLSIEVSRAE